MTISKPKASTRVSSKKNPPQSITEIKRYGHGRSAAAGRRLEKASRGKLHTGQPGQVITRSDRRYIVAVDGSFRGEA